MVSKGKNLALEICQDKSNKASQKTENGLKTAKQIHMTPQTVNLPAGIVTKRDTSKTNVPKKKDKEVSQEISK